MECRDRGREWFLIAGLGRARARMRRAGPRVGGGDENATAECDSLITSDRSYMSCSNAAAPGLGFRCERSERILGEKRPRAFAFLPHDRGPILGCRIEGVDI